jgi:hypothetical protein
LYGANQSDFSDAVILDDTTIPINTQNNIWCYKSRMMLYDSCQLGTKTITENGTYSAQDDGLLGYSEVTVDVAGDPLPSVVYFSSVNGSSDTVMSYTFTESGIYQIYSLIKYGDALLSSPTLELNDVAISVQTYSNSAYIIVYAQIEVSSGDVLKCVPTATGENSGRQLVVLNGANFDPFTFIGFVPNDGSRFDITGSKYALEVYDMGYWQGNNNYQYHIIAGEAQSVPIPGGSGYYYGGIYAIKLQ